MYADASLTMYTCLDILGEGCWECLCDIMLSGCNDIQYRLLESCKRL